MKTKSSLDFYTSQKKREFFCVLCAHAQFLCCLARFDLASRCVCQPIQPLTYTQLLVSDEALPQRDFAIINCSDAMMTLFYPLF